MSIIEKGFSDPKSKSRPETGATQSDTGNIDPADQPAVSDTPETFDLTNDSRPRPAGKGFRGFNSPGNPAHAPPPPVTPPTGQGAGDPSEGTLIARETLRPSQLASLKAVNEAYQPIIDADADEDGIDLASYWRIVRRHKWGILSVALIVLIIGVLNALSKTPIYRAQTTLVAEPFQRQVTLEKEYINSASVFLFYDTQFDIIRSRAIAERVVNRLGLVDKARADQEAAASSDAEKDAGIVDTITAWFDWRNWVSDEDVEAEVAPPTDDELRNSLIAQIQGGVSVQGGKQSQIIKIAYEHNNAREAARRANAIAKAYVNYGEDNRTEASQKTNKWLQEQIVEVRKDLKRAEAELLAYQEQTGLIDTTQLQNVSNDRLKQITEQLVDAKSRLAEAKLRYDQARQLSLNTSSIENITTILPNNNVRSIALDLSKADREIGELQARVTDEHPLLKEAKVKREEARKALARELDKVVNTLSNEYQVAERKVREFEGLLDEENAALGDATGATLELVRLEREVENHRKLYEALLVRLQETDVTSDLDASNIQILDVATAPTAPFKPNKTRIVMLAGILGLALGIGLAFVREHLDRTLRTLDDIEEKLGLTALGMVPIVRNRKEHRPETHYLDAPRSPFAEKLNHIRTGLLFSSIDNPPGTILITSATGGEGKTTLASNLAGALSQLDKTLLLEVDLRKPALAERLGITEPKGLADLVTDLGLAPEVIHRVNDESNLYLLPCGTRPRNPLELLSSQQFRVLMGRLQEHFRYIVLDGPPLLAVSDAAVLGHLVDTTIVAAKAETTSLKMIKDALSLMRKARVEPEGVVLTQADTKRMAYYGGSYYHYDKRYYGEEADAKKAPA